MEFADALRASYEAYLQAIKAPSRPTSPRDYVWASGRRDCVRALALDLLHPEDRQAPEPEMLAKWHGGDQREQALVGDLHQLGPRARPPFRVVEGQRRFEIHDRDGTLLIVGKVDGILEFDRGAAAWQSSNGGRLPRRVVFEVKSGQTVARARDLEDLDRSPWTRGKIDQLLVYLLALGEPWGLFIIDRPGLPLFLPVRLEDHLGRAERFLVDSRAAVDARFGRAPLPPFPDDLSICRRCDHYGRSCAPPTDFGAGAKVITDPALIELAEVRERNAPAAREYDRADRKLKEALRGVDLAILGDFEARGRWQQRTAFNVPPEIRERYKVIEEQGSFRLEIERMSARGEAAN